MPDPQPSTGPVIVIGHGELAAEVVRELQARGADWRQLRRPTDRDLTRALSEPPRSVAIVSDDDIYALRIALVAEHARPQVPLVVTIFDATVAAQVLRAVPNSAVVALADVAAPVLAEDCASAGPRVGYVRAGCSRLMTQGRPYDAASRLLMIGVLGLGALLGAETAVGTLAFGEPLTTAFYEAAKATATVGADNVVEHGPTGYAAVAGVGMLLTTAFTAAATAGLVHRLTARRLVSLVGRRTLPRRGHVIVVGLGQVGLRLCLTLRQRGVRAVAVERDRDASTVHLAKRLGIPVIIGDGTERGLLLRLGVRRARALASVTSDDHVNIAVSVAALAVRPDLRIVLRAGDDDAVTETRALFPIGVVRDVNRLAASRFADLSFGPAVSARPDAGATAPIASARADA